MRRKLDYWLAEARRTVHPREDELIGSLTHSYNDFFGELALSSGNLRAGILPYSGANRRSHHLLKPVQEYLDFNEVEIKNERGEP